MDSDFSPYAGLQLTFESIGASVWKALSNFHQSQLAAGSLLQAYFEYRLRSFSFSSCGSEDCRATFYQFGQLDEEAVYLHGKDFRRSALLTSIGILDSFLSDALRFLFLSTPSALPSKVQSPEPGESPLEHVERVVRRYFSNQMKRIRFLAGRFGIALDEQAIGELARLTDLRNEIVHHSGFYRFFIDNGEIRAEDKPLPVVTREDAARVDMIVTEICDTLLVGMSNSIFGHPPKVRPLTPELSEVFRRIRQEWTEKKRGPADVEEYNDPGWSEKVLSDPNLPWVGDDRYAFLIRPTGIDQFPVLMSFLWNKRHGMPPMAAVDDHPMQELSDSQKLLGQMLVGNSILVEYHDDRQDGPRYARFSLSGFAEAWKTAWERKKKSVSND